MTDIIMVSWMDEETEIVTKIRYVRQSEFGDAILALDPDKDYKKAADLMIKILRKLDEEVL